MLRPLPITRTNPESTSKGTAFKGLDDQIIPAISVANKI